MAVAYFMTGLKPFLFTVVVGLKLGKNKRVLLGVYVTGCTLHAPLRMADLSCHLSRLKIRIRGLLELVSQPHVPV